MIESMQNKIVKQIKGLQLRKNREKEGLFVVEGNRFVEEIPQGIVSYYAISEGFQKEKGSAWLEKKANVFVLTDSIFAAISDTEHPQGILAVCRKEEQNWKEYFFSETGFYVLVEQLQDPGNLGTILRTADACGVDGIFLSKGCTDVYNPKTLRATMGAIFHVPIFQEVDLQQCIQNMQEKTITVLAAHLQGTSYPYDMNLKKGCGILIGNEGNGLSDDIAAACDSLVKLPMLGQAESLNASVAAGVLLYEVVRQRIV